MCGRAREVDRAAAAPAGSGWPVWTAGMITKILAPVQKDFLDERRLIHILAHCRTLSDISPNEPVRIVEASPANNIYIIIPHALRPCLEDPILDVARARLQFFCKKLFGATKIICSHGGSSCPRKARGEHRPLLHRQVSKRRRPILVQLSLGGGLWSEPCVHRPKFVPQRSQDEETD